MLINLSNHPLSEWSEAQINQAKLVYKNIVDETFPTIDPDADVDLIVRIAKEKLSEIVSRNPDAIHIMGEHTFTFCFVRLAQKIGLKCIASTTVRDIRINDDGEKIRMFRFKQFREYPKI